MEMEIEKELENYCATYHLPKLAEKFSEKNINPATPPHDLFADAVLMVDGNRIYCHKVVLSTYSDFFEAIFLSNMKEAITSEVQLKDVDLETVKNMLSFMYSGNIDKIKINVSLLAAADKYGVLVLRNICIQTLPKMIKSDNVVEICQAGMLLDNKDLVDTTSAYITENWPKLSKQDDIKEFSRKYPDFLIEITNRLSAKLESHKEKNKAQLCKTETGYIKLKALDHASNEIHFRVKMTTQLIKLKQAYSERVGIPISSIRFIFDGRRINDDETPEQLEMEQDDMIHVFYLLN